jgi:hypothetical protein
MQRAGVLTGSGSSRSLVGFSDEVGFCLVLEESMIFDSVVADLLPTPRLWRPSVFGQIRGRIEAKSANIELCVICRSSLKSKI